METDKEIQELVIERLRTLPEDTNISIGSEGEFSKQKLIEHVTDGDEIGKKIIDVEMSFLRSLKEGVFYDHDEIIGDAS